MKTLVEIEDAHIEALDALAVRSKKSRSALIRKAIADFLAIENANASDDGFGLWGKRKIDGLEYQKKIRSEW